MKIPLTSNKDPQNVANRLKDAGKLLKVHFMLKLKVELEVCGVCYITGNNLLKKYVNTTPLKMSKFPFFDHTSNEKSFSILFCLSLNISRLINLQFQFFILSCFGMKSAIRENHIGYFLAYCPCMYCSLKTEDIYFTQNHHYQ